MTLVAAEGRRPVRLYLLLASVFTAAGAFLAAFGAGLHEGLVEGSGAGLLGAASVSFLIGLRRILEPEAVARRVGER